MFIPKKLKEWKPVRHTHMRCHWCAGEKVKVGELVHVRVGPMRWSFCSEECCNSWQELRHDHEVLEWLQLGTGERAEVLARKHDATAPTTEASRRFAALCGVHRVALSVRKDP